MFNSDKIETIDAKDNGIRLWYSESNCYEVEISLTVFEEKLKLALEKGEKFIDFTMETNLELSKYLKLTYIDKNSSNYDKLISVVCYFTFFGLEGQAYILLNKLDNINASYAMTEIDSDLSESFNDQLEDEENWPKIVLAVKEYVKQWELNNID